MKNLFIILSFLFSFAAFAALETDRQEQSVYNFYGPNAGFENGIKDVTANSATKTWSTTKYTGNKALKCALDTIGDYCELKLVTNPGAAANMEYGFFYKEANGTVKADVIDGSGNVVRTINPLPSVSAFQEKIAEFVAAASTSYKLRFTATSDTDTDIYIDQVRMSRYLGVGSVDLGNKQYDLTTACSGSTCITGDNSWVTVRAVAIPYKDRSNPAVWRLKGNIKGTVSGGPTDIRIYISGVVYKNISGYSQSINADVGRTVTDQYVDANTGTMGIYATGSIVNVSVDFDLELNSMPTWATDYVSEQVTRAENANQFAGITWSHANCEFTSTSASMAVMNKSNCSGTYLGQATAGTSGNSEFVVPNLNPGYYEVTLNGNISASGSTGCDFDIYDGTTEISSTGMSNSTGDNTMTGIIQYTSIQTNKIFQIRGQRTSGSGTCYLQCVPGAGGRVCNFSIKPIYPTANMPQIINSVGTNYSGVTVLNSTRVGQATDNSACTSSPCTTYNETGDWVSSVVRDGTGIYTVNINAGVFTSAPNCICIGRGVAEIVTCAVGQQSTSSVLVSTWKTSDLSSKDEPFVLQCHGVK